MRYAIAAIGPVAGAGAQFVLSLLLLHLLSPTAFGSFSFLLVTSIFSAGLWAGLFCSPLPVLINQSDPALRDRAIRSLMTLSTLGSVIVFALFVPLALALKVPVVGAILFGVYAAMFVLRWFGRTYAYAVGRPLRVTLSDIAYSVVLLGGVGVAALAGRASVELCYGIMALSAGVGLLSLGTTYLRQLCAIDAQALRHYRPIWRDHAGWSLVGIFTTEATINCHVYLVTAIAGLAAYAPIAATALLIRPIGVAQNALGDFERARMARQIGAGQLAGAFGAVRFFRAVLLAAWIMTCVAAIGLFLVDPHLLFPREYDVTVLAVGGALWLAVSGARLVRTPESTLLQAAGAFRPLAQASMVACLFSIGGVLAALWLIGNLWSIAGILLGEMMFAAWTWRQAHRWRGAARAQQAEGGTGGIA